MIAAICHTVSKEAATLRSTVEVAAVVSDLSGLTRRQTAMYMNRKLTEVGGGGEQTSAFDPAGFEFEKLFLKLSYQSVLAP
jgi:hypothetical protein